MTTERGGRVRPVIPILEKDVEKELETICDALKVRWLRNVVKIRSKNPRHHQTGQSRGIPDYSVRRDSWPVGMWLALECKKPVGWEWSSVEQKELNRVGATVLVHSAEDVMAAVKAADESLRRLAA